MVFDSVSTRTAFEAGYRDQPNEVPLGLQTEKSLQPGAVVFEWGASFWNLWIKLNPCIYDIYHNHIIIYNEAFFSGCREDSLKARSAVSTTGLLDAYGRGRIIGDYLRIVLYGHEVDHLMPFGVAGLSNAGDSLSVIRISQLVPTKDFHGIVTKSSLLGEYYLFGNKSPEVDQRRKELTEEFIPGLCLVPAYHNTEHNLSVLTINSNVMSGRDQSVELAAIISYADYYDGINYTFSIVSPAIEKTSDQQVPNLSNLLDSYSELWTTISISISLKEISHPSSNEIDVSYALTLLKHKKELSEKSWELS